MTAILSPCEKYRYTLTRSIAAPSNRRVLFIMLNPSTADAVVNDPTIRRCIEFARREKAAKLTVVNLFALRATNPAELEKHPDPVGPANNFHLQDQIGQHRAAGDLIVAAWGANPVANYRAREVLESFGPFWCLGLTKSGQPRHPLYLRSDAPLMALTAWGTQASPSGLQ